jgi:hypothetical protein
MSNTKGNYLMDKPIRCDLPKFVHDELSKRRGGKKLNAELILIEWAKKQQEQAK